MQQTWFVTGASRGFGVEIVKAALRAGHRVVATGRSRARVGEQVGAGQQLLVIEHDVTNDVQTHAAVTSAIAKFGTIDVLVNNAGFGHLGFFEETSDREVENQFATNVFGLMKVTRAILPIMRAARRGCIFNISSLAGIRGNEFASLYCASKFAVSGFTEALAQEVAPFGITVTSVEPGPFRTEFLSAQSLRVGSANIGDYDTRRDKVRAGFEKRNGRQPGDPVKLAEALVHLAGEPKPPLRFAAGSFAYNTAQAKLVEQRSEYERWRALAESLDFSE